MDKYVIRGGAALYGEVGISGSKNASLPIMAGSLLTEEDVIINNVPDLTDIRMMISLLENLGKKIEFISGTLIIHEIDNSQCEALYDAVRKMRASIAVMGPLLARRRNAKISLPGGCVIGQRPIDLHIRGMKALGTEIVIEHGYIWAQAKELTGRKMNLLGNSGPSVLGTENVMMAATLANGVTVIEGAACEPEIEALSGFLTSMGARIKGAGTSVIEIEGVKKLQGCNYTVIPDRIEAGTFIAAAGITGGDIRIRNANVSHMDSAIEYFSKAGVEFEITSMSEFRVRGGNIRPIEVETMPYPYFPTDLQAQLMAMVSISDGTSILTENIFPDRFMHAAELNRMGAEIKVDGPVAVVRGVKGLSGASVMVSDLRAGAGLVLAGLSARGESEILRIYHIDRGYENLEGKFSALGAEIKRVPQ